MPVHGQSSEDKLKYAQEQNGDVWTELNDTGRAAQKAGGHFAYLKSLDDKALADKERQRLNDEKLKYDVKNAKRIFKTYLVDILVFSNWTCYFFNVGNSKAIRSISTQVCKMTSTFKVTKCLSVIF